MNERRKSDGRVVPEKLPNNPGEPGAEVVEGRRPAKGNAASETRPGPSAGLGVSSDLDRVRQVAQRDTDVRFTALLHHVTVDRLREAYRAIRPGAAPGVDGVTWKDYGQDLEENLRIFTPGSAGARTGRGRLAGRTYPRPTGGSGRSGSLRWKTRSSSGRWSRC
jgi:RNA-directed DNA polymerase